MKLIKKISYCFFAFSLIIFVLSTIHAPLSVYFNRTVCQFARKMLALLTSAVSFSIFEGAVLLTPFFVIIGFVLIYKSKRSICKQFFSFLSVFLVIPSLYILTIGVSYKIPSPFTSSSEVDEEKAIYSAEVIAAKISDISENERIPSDRSELYGELARSYLIFSDLHGYNGKIFPHPKNVIFSKALSRMGTLAFYSFLTGEVNINTKVPEYTLPFTVAHEYAHYVGIASERDANFMAFLVCVNSKNEYVRYSGLLSGLEYLLSDIYKSDKEAYAAILSRLPERAVTDIMLYRKYSQEYENGFVFDASDRLNSAHLDIWDAGGKYSYSDVSRLIVAYIN